MKERPIIFNGEMIRSLLDGRKTQTRRIVKGMALEWLSDQVGFSPAFVADKDNNLCPYGQPSDRLWVRETFALERQVDADQLPPFTDGRPLKQDDDRSCWVQSHYRATDPTPELAYEYGRDTDEPYVRWRPSIHMPRWASRITLEITGVRLEHLKDITRGDAMAEGCPFPNMAKGDDPRDWFGMIWESIHGHGSWDANPFVWVIKFKRLK